MDVIVDAPGARLAAELHLPAGPPRAVALVAGALGVRRGFYAPLAAFLADGGIAAVTVDYRGIGGSAPASLRGFRATLDDWADDLAAALARVRAVAPDAPAVWVGHSMGGQLLGLVADPPVERALLIAAQHGHWRNWVGWPRLGMAALWWTIPVVARAAGRLPMRALGQGEDVPAGVARQWARWGRDREYLVGYARRRGRPSGFDTFRGALRCDALADDPYAPISTVRPLAAAFRAARVEVREIEPRAVGRPRLGHFGAFRPDAAALWADWRAWLLDRLPPCRTA